MIHPTIRLKWNIAGEPTIEQATIGSLDISWNPDDERFYVFDIVSSLTLATFAGDKKGFANAIQFARRKERGSKR